MEHIHSAFLVANSRIPYLDFFQHHNPLMWYLLAPVFYLPDIDSQLIALKIIGITVGFINVSLTGYIIYQFTKSVKISAFVSIIVMSSFFMLQNGYEIRPDNFMITFILLPLFAYLKNKFKNTFLTGLLLSISFLFLQKAVIFILLFEIYFLIGVIFASISIKEKMFVLIKYHLGLALLPLLLFLLLTITNTFEIYWFYNFILNTSFMDVFSPFRTLFQNRLHDNFILILFTFGFLIYPLILGKKSLQNDYMLPFLAYLLYSVSLFTITRSPYSQYFLPLILFGGICFGIVIREGLLKFNNSGAYRIGLFLILASSLISISLYKTNIIRDYGYTRQSAEMIQIANKTITEKQKIPIQANNLFIIGNNYYWFSEEGIDSVCRLITLKKAPEEIIKPDCPYEYK